MITSQLIQILENFGLDKKEGAVYLAGLELGPASVQQLAQKSQLKRTTLYLITESLKAKGLFSESKNQRGVQFIPVQPDRLINILDERKTALQKVMPELMALTHSQKETKPNVRYYEGRENILTIEKETLEGTDGEILLMGSFSDIYLIYASPKLADDAYRQERIRKNIFLRMLVIREPRSIALLPSDKSELRETRFLPTGTELVTVQYIYQNKIAYISPKQETMGMIIESKDLASMERQKFNVLWETCKRK
jgi:sugar-specific transcriptional regulator TrmB